MKIAFIGSGAWATALAYALGKNNGLEICMYGKCEEEVTDIRLHHQNASYFPDVALPSNVTATLSAGNAIRKSDAIVLAVPSHAIADIVPLLEKHCDSNPIIINVIKGFDPVTGEGISSLIKKKLAHVPMKGVVSLVGPSFAYDVAHDDLTAVCAVSENIELARDVQRLFSSETLRVYVQSDVIGAEIGAGMKNIIAIASGIMDGLGYKDNTRAALITRGLAEITRYGVANGANKETFLGLTGVGDLTLTCSSTRSRNYSLGVEIGKENSAKEVLARNQKTVEGVLAAKTIYFQAKEKGIDTPITDAVYAVLHQGALPSYAVKMLMGRSLKKED